jgi:hypothetical protein
MPINTKKTIIFPKNQSTQTPGAGLSHPCPPDTSSAKHPPTTLTHKPQNNAYSPNKEHKSHKFTHLKITPKRTENTPNSSPVSLHTRVQNKVKASPAPVAAYTGRK